MKKMLVNKLLTASALACLWSGSVLAQTNAPSTFKHITIDGSFNDWAGVPVAYTAPVGAANAIQYENVYVANDENYLYIRFTLYSARADAFANSYDNIFIDSDTNAASGFPVNGGAAGIGSEMLIQGGAGYQEKSGGFNEGNVNGLGWNIAGSADGTDFELAISRSATFASDNSLVFASNTIAFLLEGDNTSFTSVEFAPPVGGIVYSFAAAPPPPAGNLSLVTLTSSTWKANAAGTDLGTNWLNPTYDDTVSGWVSGHSLFGYTPTPGSYPAIQTALASGPNTYYFRTHFTWTNNTANVAFVVTNYLSDGAVYYLNGTEVRRVRMPTGTISYATAASGTNSPVGRARVFGIDGAVLTPAQSGGDNILEVETHQAPASSADMVFGLSLTAATNYPVYVVNSNLPASQAVSAGQTVTFTSDVIGSGPLSYQWYYNTTTAIAGANSATYSIPVAQVTNSGSYTLQVSNSFSSTTTLAALLTVTNAPVVIVTQPVSLVVVEGTPATLSVSVSGTAPFTYQWLLNGSPIANATNAAYSIASAFPTDSGAYRVTITNPGSTTNSSVANLTVLTQTIPPALSSIVASASQIVVTFSSPLDPVTASTAAKYAVSGGVTVSSATVNPSNPAQVILAIGVAPSFGTVYTLTVNGVADQFGNVAHVSGQFARDITIDGSFDDWTGLTPIYTTASPSGVTGAADFKAIYMYDDANYYYFRVTLWTDIDPSAGQFPFYVSMYYDTDNNAGTGYLSFGSDMLVQSGFSYQEKDGTFNDGFGINNLNWLSLPASPGTNFEYQMSKAATFGEDGSKVFSANAINFFIQSATSTFAAGNQVPADGGVVSYSNVTPVTVAPLPLGKLAIAPVTGAQAAVYWVSSATLQVSTSVTGPWTNLPAASNPYVIPASGAKQFFRLQQ